MPRGDGTGPRGKGPGSGRGMGRRAGNKGGGMGIGAGRGLGRGMGQGSGRGNLATPSPQNQKREVAKNTRMKAVINEEECNICGACVLSCPEGAITPGEKIQIDETRCTGCGECLSSCPFGAISLK